MLINTFGGNSIINNTSSRRGWLVGCFLLREIDNTPLNSGAPSPLPLTAGIRQTSLPRHEKIKCTAPSHTVFRIYYVLVIRTVSYNTPWNIIVKTTGVVKIKSILRSRIIITPTHPPTHPLSTIALFVLYQNCCKQQQQQQRASSS